MSADDLQELLRQHINGLTWIDARARDKETHHMIDEAIEKLKHAVVRLERVPIPE